ncbi:NlpC/P60 family protein [Vibrio salinus]|uniref:NlpC/P60 family protein n=1 Tax=Vibrio salinus TaxID=2899784 RepID=UPI001E2DF8B1|nr:NlpC/P60 family protein [Vibrio salinus]MCE0495894.1 NlpC/P60 family protein [Vibrio salinus]
MMKKEVSCILIWLIIIFCAGCSTTPSEESVFVNPHKTDLSNSGLVRNGLITQYEEWKGTPYSYGGLSKRGVDCSGFVYAVFLEQFGAVIPRTTKGQSGIGKKIARSQLRSGDLVFFKTGHKARHVGIYYGQNQFIHASESRGVIISSLNNVYWKSKYWQAKRVQ